MRRLIKRIIRQQLVSIIRVSLYSMKGWKGACLCFHLFAPLGGVCVCVCVGLWVDTCAGYQNVHYRVLTTHLLVFNFIFYMYEAFYLWAEVYTRQMDLLQEENNRLQWIPWYAWVYQRLPHCCWTSQTSKGEAQTISRGRGYLPSLLLGDPILSLSSLAQAASPIVVASSIPQV